MDKGKGKKWIAGAIKHPGALHKQLGIPNGENIPAGTLAKAAESKGKLGQRARLAETLMNMHEHVARANESAASAHRSAAEAHGNMTRMHNDTKGRVIY